MQATWTLCKAHLSDKGHVGVVNSNLWVFHLLALLYLSEFFKFKFVFIFLCLDEQKNPNREVVSKT